VLAGATTNTSSLGAAQQTLAELPGVSAERAALPALAYAVSYPAETIGIIGTILLLKRLMRIDPVQQAEAFAAEQRKTLEPLARRALVIDNPNLEGITVDEVPGGNGRRDLANQARVQRMCRPPACAAAHWRYRFGRGTQRIWTDTSVSSHADELVEAPGAVIIARDRANAVLGKTVRSSVWSSVLV
jgi:hypothetical protein